VAHGGERVTVVIPAWGDYVDFLPDAVASARAQGGNVRVVVVDNANADPLRARDGGDVIRSDVELSTGAARNLGLSHVTTEYVVFLDADDQLLPGALAHLVAGLDRHPDALALVGRIVEPSGALFRAPRPLAASLSRHRRAFAWINSVWSLVPTQGCTIMRTAAVRDAGGYGDASHGEDWTLAVSLAFRGAIVFDPAPALVYRARRGAPRPPRRTLLDNGRHVRARLRDEPAFKGRPALWPLSGAQALAVFAAQPLATLLRPLRERPSRRAVALLPPGEPATNAAAGAGAATRA
jgi:glycosyltransferase involved in cell wall biosynthesis